MSRIFATPLPVERPESSSGVLSAYTPFEDSGQAADAAYEISKRVLDCILAAFLLVVTAPVVLLAAVLIRLTSRGPAIYTQPRLGRYGRTFTIFKLRTMYQDSEATTGAVWSQRGDPRVTTLGRFLRATHIDEFPQLLNVLSGTMSLSGPRPERPEIVEYLRTKIDHYTERLQVRPGITGLAQVQLPPDTCLDEVGRKLVCDLYYIAHVNFWLDVRIMICTGLFLFGVPLRASRKVLGIPAPLGNGE